MATTGARGGRLGTAVAVVLVAAWAVLLGSILRHRVFVTNDTLISYAHVWYLAGALWHRHHVPLAMPVVDAGRGLVFPYGVVPWTIGAFLRPLLGDRAVTLVLVLGTAGTIAGTFAALPELRRGWWAAAALVNPALLYAPLLGQTVFLWAIGLLLFAVAAWRRERVIPAVVLAGLAQATHPALLVPITAGLVVARLWSEPRRRMLLAGWLLSLALAAPAVVMTLRAPVLDQASLAARVGGLLQTLGPRALVLAVPVALVALARRTVGPWLPMALTALLAATAVVFWQPFGLRWASAGLRRDPSPAMLDFTSGPGFRTGRTYRLLRIADGKVGAYQLLQAGARLDADFFPESIDRRSWPSVGDYERFLAGRHVDAVMIWKGYDRKYRTNEHGLLQQLVQGDGCPAGTARASITETAPAYVVYDIAPHCR